MTEQKSELTELQRAMVEHDDDMARLDRNNPVSQPPVAEVPESTAWQIVYNALESEGSKVIYDSEAGRVVYCPNSSGCENTPDHEPDCWLGQAMRLIPSSGTLPPDPASSITEKAREIALKLKRDADDMFAMPVDDEPIVTQWAAIIAGEFGADAAPSSTRSIRSTRPGQSRST